QIGAGASTHIDPSSAEGRWNQIPKFLATLEKSLAKVVIRSGLTGIKALHPRSVVVTADGFEGQVIKNLEIGSQAHEKNQRTEEPKNQKRRPTLVLWFFGSWNLCC